MLTYFAMEKAINDELDKSDFVVTNEASQATWWLLNDYVIL